jgi:TatD family-associated radical SAM protein
MNKAMSVANKKPSVVYWLGDNLYLNITNRCSNNCYFCFRKYKKSINGFNLTLKEEPSLDQIINALHRLINRRPWKEVVFCGFGEPFERLDYVLEVTRWIKKHFTMEVRIDTNGQAYLLNKDRNVIEELKEAKVDRLSVSLNAHNKQTYDYVCKPKFGNAYEAVLQFIEEARAHFDTEITAVTIPEVDISEVREIARKMGVKFRLREYQPCFW